MRPHLGPQGLLTLLFIGIVTLLVVHFVEVQWGVPDKESSLETVNR